MNIMIVNPPFLKHRRNADSALFGTHVERPYLNIDDFKRENRIPHETGLVHTWTALVHISPLPLSHWLGAAAAC